jgi:hypothetical protein
MYLERRSLPVYNSTNTSGWVIPELHDRTALASRLADPSDRRCTNVVSTPYYTTQTAHIGIVVLIHYQHRVASCGRCLLGTGLALGLMAGKLICD